MKKVYADKTYSDKTSKSAVRKELTKKSEGCRKSSPARNIECGTGVRSFALLVTENWRLKSKIYVFFPCEFVVNLSTFIH